MLLCDEVCLAELVCVVSESPMLPESVSRCKVTAYALCAVRHSENRSTATSDSVPVAFSKVSAVVYPVTRWNVSCMWFAVILGLPLRTVRWRSVQQGRSWSSVVWPTTL